MTATKYNLIVEQGCDFSYTIPLLDPSQNKLDVTGYTANAAMKKFYTSMNTYPFSIQLVNGALTIAMNAVQTANIAMGRYVYDAILYNGIANTTVRLVEGIVTVNPGVAEPGINTDDELLTD
jgi:hypothetical protein